MNIKIGINDYVEMLLLQFDFTNSELVPLTVKDERREQESESQARKQRSTQKPGLQLIDPTVDNSHDTNINSLPEDLVKLDMTLVDAFFQKRVDAKKPNAYYHTVRFTFVPGSKAVFKDRFKEFMPIVYSELTGLTQLAFWRVRAYQNSYYLNDREVRGSCVVSINLGPPTPIFSSNGEYAKLGGSLVKPKNVLSLKNYGLHFTSI